MLYDGDCGFCQHWVERWQKKGGASVDYAPYQQVLKNFPQLNAESCREAVQLVQPDGSITSGAHAIFKAMSLGGFYRWLHWLYDSLPLFGRLSEAVYQSVAHHRLFLSRFMKGPVQKCSWKIF